MWFDEAGEVVEMFRNSFPLSFLFFVPIFIIISPVSPVGAAHDFAVYRMQQYDLQGSSYGCRSSLVNLEARPVDSRVMTRRCILAKLKELTMEKYKEMISQNAGALVVLLPQNLSSLDQADKQQLMELEEDLMQEETQMPVYFTNETPELLRIYNDVKTSTNSDQAGSAAEALLGSATANGFQMVIAGPQSKALTDFQVINIQGKLGGYGIEEQLPTVAIVAHYDAYGIAPVLAKGADSNGSGVVALLELARLFSKLFTNSRTHAKLAKKYHRVLASAVLSEHVFDLAGQAITAKRYNLLFLLSGGGKFNYQGTKRWIEDNQDSAEPSMLSDVSLVLCLDALGADKGLHLHVSKPPKPGSAGDTLLKNLQEVSQSFYPNNTFSMVHKKINLADDMLSWEHERFSIRKLPAFTLSHIQTHKSLSRHSILDIREKVDISALTRNVKIMAEALARQIFNLSGQGNVEIFNEALNVEENLLSSWLDFLASQPRAAQLMVKDNPVVVTLEQAMIRYLKDVKRLNVKADKREPEFVFYSGAQYTMNAYNVKPAVFDLFLALGIAAYLATVYLIVQNFNLVYTTLRSLIGPLKAKQQ